MWRISTKSPLHCELQTWAYINTENSSQPATIICNPWYATFYFSTEGRTVGAFTLCICNALMEKKSETALLVKRVWLWTYRILFVYLFYWTRRCAGLQVRFLSISVSILNPNKEKQTRSISAYGTYYLLCFATIISNRNVS